MNLLTKDFFSDESGVTAIEYGLLAALIAVVIIGALTAIGTNLSSNFYDKLVEAMQSVTG